MSFLYGFSIRHPRVTVAIAVLVTAAVSPGILKLRLRTDGHALVPPDAPEIRMDREIRERFGVEDPIVVVIRTEHPDGIFNPETLWLVHDLTLPDDDIGPPPPSFRDLPGVRPADLFSLETEHNDRTRPGSLDYRRFLEPPWESGTPLPTTRKDLDTLHEDLHQIGLFTGTLVSLDEKATSILIGVPHGASRTELYSEVKQIIAVHGRRPERIDVIGAPVAEALLGTHILEDLGVPPALLGHSTEEPEASAQNRYDFHEFRLFIARHIGLAPIAIGLMALIFVIAFRSLAAAMLPMMEIGACLVFVFGLMGWVGEPIYLTIAVLPIILTVTGVTDEIHVFTHYTHLLREHPEEPHVTIVRRTLDEMWRPVLKASLTTSIGFLSFAVSDLRPVWAFGIFTAVGLTFCMLWSFSVIPALLVLIRPRWLMPRPRAPLAEPARSGRLQSLARFTVRHRFAIVVMTLALVTAATLGARRVRVQDSWIDGFAPESTFHRTTQHFNEQFLGTHLLLLQVNAGHYRVCGDVTGSAVGHHGIVVPLAQIDAPADVLADLHRLVGNRIDLRRQVPTPVPTAHARSARWMNEWNSHVESVTLDGDNLVIAWERKRGSPRIALQLRDDEPLEIEIVPQPLIQPDIIRRIAQLEAFIATLSEHTVGGVLGTATYLSTINFMSMARRPDARSIPENAEKIDWLWSQYKRIRGEDRLRQLVDEDYARSLVTVFLENANFVSVGRLMREIRTYEREHLAPHGIRLDFAGDVAVSQTLIQSIVETQVKSLALSLAGDFAVVAIFSRSLGWGLYAIVPCALAVLLNFAIMGFTGMPLGVATSMFSGMTLGVGVDYAIHLLERYRLAKGRGLEVNAAIAAAVAGTGRPLLIDALAVSIGFGAMMLSQVPANARLGGLVIMSIANSLVGTLILLPALLRIWRPKALH